jgi:glycosyltransferase involved in cell wall biosynthesis
MGMAMRISLLSFHFAEYSLALARALSRRHQVLLFLGAENAAAELGHIPGDEESLRVRCLRQYTFRNAGCYGNMMEILHEIGRFRPEVIHCQETLRDYLTPLLPFLRRTPLVLTIHDHKPHSGGDSRLPLRSRIHRRFLRRAPDAVIVHGERIRRETEELFPWLRGRIHSVPHGLLGESGDRFRTDWHEGTVLFFGRLNRYKGLSCLVEAMNILRSRGVPVRVVIAGTGPELDPWRGRLLSDPNCILMEEFVPAARVPELFRRANVVVLPYTDATQSGVAALAINYGRPIVASDVGSLGEMVRHGVNGLLVPPGDSEALATALEQVTTDRSMAERFAVNGRAMGVNEFCWSRIADLTTTVYESVTP